MNKIYCFWTGTNEITPARVNGLNELQLKSGCDVVLITPENLPEYITEPLHPAYEYLSLVHRSDYLRAYFMHYHGGGYSDIKPGVHSWLSAFNKLGNSWVLGYKELGPGVVAICTHKPMMQRTLQSNWHQLIGCGAFICKPHTFFTSEWLREADDLLTYKYDLLKKYPGNTLGNNAGYPLLWTELLGDIFHPLVLKYNDKIVQDNSIKPDFTKNYR